MTETRKIYSNRLFVFGITCLIGSASIFYTLSLKKVNLKVYSGKPVDVNFVIFKKPEITHNVTDIINNDSVTYAELHIRLDKYDNVFVVTNALINQFSTIKRLINEANILFIRAKKRPFWKPEYIVYQMDSDRRVDIISLKESRSHLYGTQYFLLCLGVVSIILTKLDWIRRNILKKDDFNYELFGKTRTKYSKYEIDKLNSLLNSSDLKFEERQAILKLIEEKKYSG